MHQWTVLVGGTEGSEIREECYERGPQIQELLCQDWDKNFV